MTHHTQSHAILSPMWLWIAFLTPIFYAGASVLDNVLTNQKFKGTFPLVFYTSLFNIVFVPVIFLLQPPSLPPLGLVPVLLALGFINVAYLWPYYKALQVEDTSVVISFFSMGRVFLPILAFFLIGEVLTPGQYTGIGLIIGSSVFLSLSRRHLRLRFSKAFVYILFAALLIAFESVLLKYLFEQGVGWSTAVGGEMICSLIFSLVLASLPRARKEIAAQRGNFKKNFHLFFVEEMFTASAFAVETLAISLAPVTLAKGISSFTPFMALFYAYVLGKRFPSLFKERTATGSVLKKTILFGTMILGVYLIAS